jgi:hypothetical protein
MRQVMSKSKISHIFEATKYSQLSIDLKAETIATSIAFEAALQELFAFTEESIEELACKYLEIGSRAIDSMDRQQIERQIGYLDEAREKVGASQVTEAFLVKTMIFER